ncbi:hypothetical protein MUK70_00780 [Dyadobacter chenwenxiniae]|uniref:GNT-I family protein n=1 Tax=Dyadobacter chenwenxiniae TaxID=2906456 RepID=A0A9X1PNB0_9BACT|nr:hypothetical protein [Dyadobacter chenwenxiniae]MCF0062718.1 hypothetical protein [Dyadobacter chenwenxiniae]UON83537.1 hypothetical protein MUK70_00780 [Dyadobacter chenwenxiniae]
MENPAIVIVTFNRPSSLERILYSIQSANYSHNDIDLILSIDYQDSDLHREVVKIAKNFEWQYGTKTVIEHSVNLGLRKHILGIGELLNKYASIIVLEDDIYLSHNYYHFASQAVSFYQDDLEIAGISLYNFNINQYANLLFFSEKSDTDVYFINCAQSWGQVWMRKQWKEFAQWYTANSAEFDEMPNLPKTICNWPKSSWLKYHNRYCIENNKYFVYPYTSLSTNFGDSGTHNTLNNSLFQVPLQYGNKSRFQFIKRTDLTICYDGFFERKFMGRYLKVDDKDLCVDFYGEKNNRENKQYYLTPKKMNFEVVRSFKMDLKPYELNIINSFYGNEIFLYNTHNSIKMNGGSKYSLNQVQFLYQFVSLHSLAKNIKYTNIVKYYINRFLHKLL